MPFWSTFLLASAVSLGQCSVGNFCDVYTNVVLPQASAELLVAEDRAAAEAIAVNQRLYRNCPD